MNSAFISGIRLCLLDHVLHLACALQLMVDVDDPVLHIQIADRQSAEFTDAHAGMEKDVENIVVFVVHVVVVAELQEL